MLTLSLQYRLQNIAIAVTYIREKDKSLQALFVRNNPLTRGWQSDFSRPIRRNFDSETNIEGYQFLGGRIRATEFDESCVNNVAWGTGVYTDEEKALGAAALNQLKEETQLSVSHFLEDIKQVATLHKLSELDDTDVSTSVVTHCWHLDLGVLNEEQAGLLHFRMQITHTVAAISWLPLSKIVAYSAVDKPTAYSIVPGGNGHHRFLSDRRGLQNRLFAGNQWVYKNGLELLERPVVIRADNAELLFKITQLDPQPYTLPEVLDFKDCEFLGKDPYTNKPDVYQVMHIPTQISYSIQFYPAMFVQATASNSNQDSLLSNHEVENLSRNQLLAAKLYEAQGVPTLPVKLIKVDNWLLAAYEQHPRQAVNLQNLNNHQQRQFLVGLGCDLAFANTGILSNNASVSTGKSTAAVCLVGNGSELRRFNLENTFIYQSEGRIKDLRDWLVPTTAQAWQHLPGVLFQQLCQLPLEDWVQAKDHLLKITPEARTNLVERYGYGDKQALARQINHRVEQTVGIIENCMNRLVNLPQDRIQNVAIAVTFEEAETNQPFVLFVRNNPLTRGWKSDLYRWAYQALDLNANVDVYQFPGGSIDQADAALPFPWLERHFSSSVEQHMAKAALRELWEESGLKLDPESLSILELNPANFTFQKKHAVNYVDFEKKTASTLHYFHLHLGQITSGQKVRLFRFQDNQIVQPPKTWFGRDLVGRDTVAVSWVRLDTIQHAETANQRINFSIVPRDTLSKGGHYKITSQLKGLEKVTIKEVGRDAYRLQCLELPVSLHIENARCLEAWGYDIRQTSYTWPLKLARGEFEVTKSWRDDRHEWYQARHVPTGMTYQLKFCLSKSNLANNTSKVAAQQQRTAIDVQNEFYQNEYLTAKLYEAFGVCVLSTHLIENADGTLGIGYLIPEGLVRKPLPSSDLPDSLTDGVGCDILLANFNAMAYGSTSNLGVVSDNYHTYFRLDYSGGLKFRGRGLLKELIEWKDTFDFNAIINHPHHKEFRLLCQQMDNRRWQRALAVLERVAPVQIEAIVSMHGYGTPQERQQLAHQLIQRRAHTISVIRRHLVLPENFQPSTREIVNIVSPIQALDFCKYPLREFLETEKSFYQQLNQALSQFNSDIGKAKAEDAKWLRQEVVPYLSAIQVFWEEVFLNLLENPIDSLMPKDLVAFQAFINQLHALFHGNAFARYFMKLISYAGFYKNFDERGRAVDFTPLKQGANAALLETNYANFLIAPVHRLTRYALLFKELYVNTPTTEEFKISKHQLHAILERLLFLNQQANRIQRVTEYLLQQPNLEIDDIEYLMMRWHQQINTVAEPQLPMEEAQDTSHESKKVKETPQNVSNSYQLISAQLDQPNDENKQVVISSTQNANQASSSTTSNEEASAHISEPPPNPMTEVNYPSQPAPQPQAKRGPRGHFTPSGYEKFENKFKPVNPPSDSDSEEEYDDEEYMSSRTVKLK